MRYWIYQLVVVLICFISGNLYGQMAVITAMDSASYWVGDPILIRLRIDDNKKEIKSVKTDTSVKANEAIEILDYGKWNKDSLDDIWRTSLTAAVYDSGRFTLPEFRLLIEKDSSTDTLYAIPAEVSVSTLPVTDTTAIAPIKNIVRTPSSWRDYLPWMIGAAAFLVVLLLALYFIRKRGKLPPEKPLLMTPVAAYELALTQLNRLKEIKPWEKGKIMEYQVELTQIIRQYMTNRYDIRALELSSDETLRAAKRKIPSAETLSYLSNLLNVADYVKFAKAVPPDEIHEHVMEMALSFIKKTRQP